MDHLFVYGTLRRGSQSEFARMLASGAQFVASARVPGRLYDFGHYPGAVPSNESDRWIQGEVHGLGDSQILPVLDEYEGPEYSRTMVSAQTEDGGAMDCWIYWYVGVSLGRAIDCGDWLKR